MNKLALFEEWLNKLVIAFGDKAKAFMQKLTPTQIKKGGQKLIESKARFKSNLHLAKNKVQEKAALSLVSAKEKIAIGKVKTAELVVTAKQTDWKNIRIKKILLSLIAFIAPPFLRLKNWYIGLKPATIATSVVISSVVTVTSVGIYQQTEKLAEKARGPASEEVKVIEIERPKYYKLDEKALSVTNIVLPTYLESTGTIKKLVIDFTFITSNRYIKAYFWDNPHIVNDRLNTMIEPIAVEFPLEDEGKDIIKDKIKREMNILLKELHIEGQIQEVYIDSITGA
ncbi:MAG: hypothetical protein Fur0010_15680 [Bdellovibrio sp.]